MAHYYGETPRSFLDVVRQLQGWKSRSELAEELGVKYWTIPNWEKTNHIPPRHWDKILKIAAKQGRQDITRELLEKLAVERAMPKQGRPRKKP